MKYTSIGLLFTIIGILFVYNNLSAQDNLTPSQIPIEILQPESRCPDYTVDASVQNFAIEEKDDEEIASLTLVFNITRNSGRTHLTWQVYGNASVPIDSDYMFAVVRLVKDTVNDGFEHIQEILQDHYVPWAGIVSGITLLPDKVTVQASAENNYGELNEGDLFHIFPSVANGNYGYDAYNSYCNRFIARVVLTEINNQTLTFQSNEPHFYGPIDVNIGDIVRPSNPNLYPEEDQEGQIYNTRTPLLKLGEIRGQIHIPSSRYENMYSSQSTPEPPLRRSGPKPSFPSVSRPNNHDHPSRIDLRPFIRYYMETSRFEFLDIGL